MIIGLAGRAGSGKSTCAAWLKERYNAVEFSLAHPLKGLAMDVFGFAHHQVHGTQAQKEAVDPRWGISPREALIRLGHYARNWLGPDVWLNACLFAIRESRVPLAVVSDVRYPNEAKGIVDVGGYVIRLRCPDAETTVNPDAPSERSVDEIHPAHISAEIDVPRSPGATLLLSAFAALVSPLLVRNG